MIPTHRHGPTLEPVVASALDQTVPPLEIVIVGDGADEPTRAVARRVAAEDARVRFLDFPKAPGRGEAARHRAVEELRGDLVCYLSDDDLWLHDHVEVVLALAEEADFVTSPAVVIHPELAPACWLADLSRPGDRALLAHGVNRVPLSAGAHTKELYRRLPGGWRPAPAGTPSDLHMWQRLLAVPGVRVASARSPTVVNFPSPARSGWSVEERAAELTRYRADLARDPALPYRQAVSWAFRRLTDPAGPAAAEHAVAELDRLLRRMTSTTTWRLRERLLRLPLLRAFWRAVRRPR